MNRYKEGRPKNGWAHGKMIFQVASRSELLRIYLTVFVYLAERETEVRMTPVVLKIKFVLYQCRTDVGIVANSVAPDPRINQGQRDQEK